MNKDFFATGQLEAVQAERKSGILRDKIRFSLLSRMLAILSCAAGMLLVMLMVRKNRRAAL